MNQYSQYWKKMIHIVLFSVLFIFIGTISMPKIKAATSYPYLIKVNKQCNTITIYEKDSKGKYTVPVKAMVCSTGQFTPLGTFQTPVKYRWRQLKGNVWGQYSTRITGRILFHSVYYTEKDPSTLSMKQYNLLGTQASAGCVRLTTADAKWIYDNCPIGTTVTIYNSSNPGPLGKPEAITLNTYSWDPTDIWSPNNPWNKKKPSIKASNVTVLAGHKVSLKKGVTATDTCGNNINKLIQVDDSKVKWNKGGTYKVTYSVTDAAGKTAKKTIILKVVNVGKITFSGIKNKVYSYKKYKNKDLDDYVMTGVTAKSGKYQLPDKYVSYSYKVVQDDDAALAYKVTYKAKNPQTKKVTTETATITLDKQGPKIICSTLYLTKSEYDTFAKQVNDINSSYIKVSDNKSIKKNIAFTGTIQKVEDNKCIVTYRAEDRVGNQSKATQVVYVM